VDPNAEVEALRNRIAELTEAVAARDTFIAITAHELRNPMTPIVGQIELLLSRVRAGHCSPEQMQPRLERLQQAIARYMKRTAVLLDVSRIAEGKLELEPEQCDLTALLHETAETFIEAGRRIHVPITVTVPDRLSGTWDRLAVEQIVDNLLSNALKYGGRTPIEVSAEACGAQVRIQVRDHGGGIPAKHRARVFQRFERAIGLGERRSGFGVGLWLVRHLAESMSGAITVEEAPGGGALFP
jgi:two-component system OmpR family sensor kinase